MAGIPGIRTGSGSQKGEKGEIGSKGERSFRLSTIVAKCLISITGERGIQGSKGMNNDETLFMTHKLFKSSTKRL